MKKNRKRIIAIFGILLIVSGVILTVLLTRPKASCSLSVTTDYRGWGIDGQLLGSGTFEQKFRVTVGDCFYETHNGVWEQNPKHNVFYEKIVEITEIREDSVTAFVYGGGNVLLTYENYKNVDSTFTIADGINYYHEIQFSDYEIR